MASISQVPGRGRGIWPFAPGKPDLQSSLRLATHRDPNGSRRDRIHPGLTPPPDQALAEIKTFRFIVLAFHLHCD